ncbi:putative F-box protein At3g23260 [Bidens hawaiensis]|uniref:putative F-box protein At3g23260 n=1 Tax=Bidens hawaiensis TaxID=980011 RepID=UPI00404A9547
MADFLHDDIVCNIIARLPAKPLLRFQCVSKSWNRVIKEPSFMQLRSRKTIMIPLRDTFVFIDGTCNSTVESCFPFGTCRPRLKVIGTLNGIVLLACYNRHILYNPLTGVCKDLPSPPSCQRSAYGFGYGANSDDLKLVRIREFNAIYDVYNFRESSWSIESTSEYKIFPKVHRIIGHFVNGSLYWIAYGRSVLIFLDLKRHATFRDVLTFCDHQRVSFESFGDNKWIMPLFTPPGKS